MQNRVISFLFIFIFPTISLYNNIAEDGIKVNITNLRNNKGHVLVSLFMEGNGYPENNNLAIRKASLTIKNNSTWVIFTGVPSGKYAIAILHDENDDLHMNKTALGLPKEGYGFSNNVMGAFGPPSYKRANFIYKANTLIEINIKTRY